MTNLEIIHKLRSNNSSTFKLAVLKAERTNHEWCSYLYDVYNPFILYGKSGDKNNLQDDLDNLKLCRSINAGVTAVTINKAYPNLIPAAGKVMKAYDYGKKRKPLTFPLYAGIKYDGHSVTVIPTEDEPTFYSSGGIVYEHDINLDLPVGFIFFAERIATLGKLGDRHGCSLEGSLGNKFAKPTNHYKIFDAVTTQEYNEGVSNRPYKERRNFLSNLCNGTGLLAEEYLVKTQEDLELLMRTAIIDGWEGLVLKSLDMPWRDSKSRKIDFCKYKRRQTADLYCMEEIPGEGNSQNIIGSIKLVDNVGRIVNVGSGLSLNGDLPFGSYLHKVVEISYEHIHDTYIQPVVICIRYDKDINDID
ncbi:MAG: hypothetical protein JHC33_08790 [Ignisphaera sp.]|nr:hypothetical protein [Ignisphaera sp.]